MLRIVPIAYSFQCARDVHKTNARALSKTLDAHEGHQLEEHARHEFHETRVGHGLREVACQMLLDEEEIIVLEVAERAKMVAKQDGQLFRSWDLPFTARMRLYPSSMGRYVGF